MKGKDLCLGFVGDASRPKVKAASCNFKQRHCASQKIIRKQSNNCGPTLSKVIHAKKLEKKLRSENLIMGKLREGCSWCERQGKVHLTQNLLREPPSHLHSVTSVVTFFTNHPCDESQEMVAFREPDEKSWKDASYAEIDSRKYTKLLWCQLEWLAKSYELLNIHMITVLTSNSVINAFFALQKNVQILLLLSKKEKLLTWHYLPRWRPGPTFCKDLTDFTWREDYSFRLNI